MQELEIAFQIIGYAGEAKSCYMEAIEMAENGDFDSAKECIQKGSDIFTNAHKAHFEIIQQEANNEKIAFSLILLHAEDQLMSAETIKIMAEKFITLYKQLGRLLNE